MSIAPYPTRYRKLPHGPGALGVLRAECLELFDQATRLDDAQRALSNELGLVRTQLAERHVAMWPRIDPKDIVHGFRYTLRGGPPPIPPVASPCRPLDGKHLRSTVLALLTRELRPMTLVEIHRDLHLSGYAIASRHPVQRLADCLAYEVRLGRARRIERATYALGELNPGTRRRIARIAVKPTGGR